MSTNFPINEATVPLWDEAPRFSVDDNDGRLVEGPEYDGVPSFVLDVPETITQLGYGSHQFFRYYGKFPSIVGREIVRRFPSNAPVVDTYVGSGTSLVEAQMAGRHSLGIDINPLAVLASEVKTRYYDAERLRSAFDEVLSAAIACRSPWLPTTERTKLEKWFSSEAIDDLGKIRWAIDQQSECNETDFLIVAFLAIVRRCSNAFDGEVRPHVKLDKKPRPPFKAFADKFRDMVSGLNELNSLRPADVSAAAVIGDNRNSASYLSVHDETATLAVAHPPYLNSFNYLNVFSLEFMWGDGIERLWKGWNLKQIRALEHRAHPATDANLLRAYYEDFFAMAGTVHKFLADGGVLAVVVGDATIHNVLEPVHSKMWIGLKELGYKPLEMWFRTTHYGIGKYAYSHRADYHGEALKRDAIMFLSK